MDKKQEEQLRIYAKEHHVPVMFEDGLAFLIQLVKENEIKSFLEIGTAIAKTAITVASLGKNIEVVTIERDPEMIKEAKINIANSNVSEQIQLIEGDANEV